MSDWRWLIICTLSWYWLHFYLVSFLTLQIKFLHWQNLLASNKSSRLVLDKWHGRCIQVYHFLYLWFFFFDCPCFIRFILYTYWWIYVWSLSCTVCIRMVSGCQLQCNMFITIEIRMFMLEDYTLNLPHLFNTMIVTRWELILWHLNSVTAIKSSHN